MPKCKRLKLPQRQKDSPKVNLPSTAYEAKIIAPSKLIDSKKKSPLKKAVKEAQIALHLKTKTIIEG